MARRLSLEVPGISDAYAAILLGEALGHIEDEQMWSFQLAESGWLTPGLLFNSGSGSGAGTSAGTITVTPFSNQVIGDAVASAAWAAYASMPLLTQCQIRSPYYSLYNIVGYDTTTNAPFGTFTLDRPWMEPGGVAISYMVYQAYFAVPVSNFRRFFAARDTTNNAPMDYWSLSQKDLSVQDPERTIFDDPSYFVPYQTDTRPNSSTLGNMLYELWPHPLSVLSQARIAAYLWKEAQKGETMERGSGADYKFLAAAAEKRYKEKKKEISARDRDMVDLYFNRWAQELNSSSDDGFATTNSQLNVGRM